jgi:hypothetical protein
MEVSVNTTRSTGGVSLTRILAGVALLAVLGAIAPRARADVITNDPSLPVTYPTGEYRSPAAVHAMYSGPGLAIVLSNIEHRAFDPVARNNVGADEMEMFNSQFLGDISVNGSPNSPTSALGPVTTEVFGKVGQTTGTFQTEMRSMDLTGSSIFGPYMIRESPTLASTGQTTVTDIGGGLFRISSFFDVFTELSIDGGQTWMPSSGSTHVELQSPLVPTPTAGRAGLALVGLLVLRRLGKTQEIRNPALGPRAA